MFRKKESIIDQLIEEEYPADEIGLWDFFTDVSNAFPMDQMIHIIADTLKNRKTRHSMCKTIADTLDKQPSLRKYIERLVRVKRLDKAILKEIDEIIAEQNDIRKTLREIYGEE